LNVIQLRIDDRLPFVFAVSFYMRKNWILTIMC